MNRNNIKERILKVFNNFSSVTTAEIEDDTDIIEYGSFDALDLVEFTMDLEAEFDVTIEDREVENLTKLKEFIDLIEKKVK